MSLMTTAEAAAYLRKPEGTLRYWRAIGYGPAYSKMGRGVLYQRSEIESFVTENTIVPSVRTEARKETIRVTH